MRRIKKRGPISQFITHHYRHFNAAALVAVREQARLDRAARHAIAPPEVLVRDAVSLTEPHKEFSGDFVMLVMTCVREANSSMAMPASMSTLTARSCPLRSLGRRCLTEHRWPPDQPAHRAATLLDRRASSATQAS